MDNQILTFGAKTRTGNFYLLFTRDPDGFFFCPCGHVSQDSSEMQDHVQICRLAEGILEYKRFTGRTLYEPTWEVKAQETAGESSETTEDEAKMKEQEGWMSGMYPTLEKRKRR